MGIKHAGEPPVICY